MESKEFEIIIIGGSYAGLSAAMALGRSIRKVLIIDSGLPCNSVTLHSHNFLTQDGETPYSISLKAKDQLMKYPTVSFVSELAIRGKKIDAGFEIETSSGNKYTSKKLIIASGIKDDVSKIEGLEACWGKTIVHCPYCHGYEFREEITGILANSDAAYHYAQLIGNLTNKLKIFTNGKADFTSAQKENIAKHNIEIVEKEIQAFKHSDGNLIGIVFKDASFEELKALYYRPEFNQHCTIPESLGAELNELGYLNIDDDNQTTVKGMYAIGDCSSAMRSVANAVADGNKIGAKLNMEIIAW